MALSGKTDRWAFRVAPATDHKVRQAAEAVDRRLTDFVIQAAEAEADRVLADRTRFELEPSAWDEFKSLLDRPAQANPRLAELFKKPSVFR